MKILLQRYAASFALTIFYGLTLILCAIFRYRRSENSENNILIIATFHNPNWFDSHIIPIVNTDTIDNLILVTDDRVKEVNGVIYACPPKILSRLITRAGSKLVWSFLISFKYKPNIYMGYAIFPCSVIALIMARLFGRVSCYQSTSGQIEVIGGGYQAENRMLSMLNKPNSFIENLAKRIVQKFDLIVVRGESASQYFRVDMQCTKMIEIITGSTKVQKRAKFPESLYDICYVGRIAESKRLDRFVNIIACVQKVIENVNVVIVGDGDMRQEIQELVNRNNLQNNITLLGKRDDVEDIIVKSKIFLLTSRKEGLSIALLEAMSAGLVPVVSDVGDLRDVVKNDVSGYIFEGDDIDNFCNSILRLLQNTDVLTEMSNQAFDIGYNKSNISKISQVWNEVLCNVKE